MELGLADREVDTMIAWNDASELKNAALGGEITRAAFAKQERRVRRDFWAKLKRLAGRIPSPRISSPPIIGALDPATPMRSADADRRTRLFRSCPSTS